MAAPRLSQVVGLLLKEQAAHGTAETLSNSADGAFMYLGDGDPPNPADIQYVYDGKIGRAAGTLTGQKNTTPAGRHRPFEFSIQARGLGSLYSAILVPPNEVHRALKAAGFTAAYSATPTPQWLYNQAVAGTGYTVLTARMFAHGSQWDGQDVLLNLEIDATGLGVPIWKFMAQSVAPLPTDQDLPAVTYAQAGILPPVAQGVVCNFGAFTGAKVRSMKFNLNRAIDKPRISQTTAGGHDGFTPGGMNPQAVITIERPARATWDPDALRASATEFDFGYQVGTVQYNRWKLNMPTAQIVNVQNGSDNDVATVAVTVEGHGSTPSASDAVNFLFN